MTAFRILETHEWIQNAKQSGSGVISAVKSVREDYSITPAPFAKDGDRFDITMVIQLTYTRIMCLTQLLQMWSGYLRSFACDIDRACQSFTFFVTRSPPSDASCSKRLFPAISALSRISQRIQVIIPLTNCVLSE